MAKINTGLEFEKFVESLYNRLVKNPECEKVTHNVKLEGADGHRQIDVLVLNNSIGIKYLTVIECRDYNRKLSIQSVDGFHSKLVDVNANKGILISRKGFSSKAIAKAKRLGISLCTAIEASQTDWKPPFDLTILAIELTPINCDFNFQAVAAASSLAIPESGVIVNGVNVFEELDKNWISGDIMVQKNAEFQKVEINSIKPPYFLSSSDGSTWEINSLNVYLKLKINYYVTNLSRLNNVEFLNNITEGNSTFFIPTETLKNINSNFKKITKSEALQLTAMTYNIRVLPSNKFKINKPPSCSNLRPL